MSVEAFKKKFAYKPELTGFIGMEREVFVADKEGTIVPNAYRVLSSLKGSTQEFGYELSACQIETRIGPVVREHVPKALKDNDERLNSLLARNGLRPLHVEVGPSDMPLTVYPDPSGRYARITEHMPRKVLLAACRVIGTHVHVGMPNHEAALHVYNQVIGHTDRLCVVGDGSCGRRLAIYKEMAPNYMPRAYSSWDDFYETALRQSFAQDPRRCWTLVRISVHGTLEFRMFGATNRLDRIATWAGECHRLCMEALADM